MMALRVLAVLAVLVLPSLAGAVEGLFHLCHGSVQLDLSCCCDHDEGNVRQSQPDAYLPGEHDACCGELKAQHVPTPASKMPSGHAWTPVPVAMVPQSVPSIPPAPETLPLAWVRLLGVHRATAPPLYIQHCSYLK